MKAGRCLVRVEGAGVLIKGPSSDYYVYWLPFPLLYKIPDQKRFKKRWIYCGSQNEGTAHLTEEGVIARPCGGAHVCHREINVGAPFAFSSSFSPSRTSAQGVVPPMFRVGHLTC